MALAEESTESHVVIGALARAVAERARPEEAEPVEGFARAYLRRRAGADDPDDLAGEVLGAFRLMAGRGAAPTAVRAFTPSRAEDGYERAGSVLETNTDDLPFLVDSVTAAVGRQGHRVLRVLHPIVGTARGRDGLLLRVSHPGEGPRRESVMHFELDRRLDATELAALEDAVREVLFAVRAIVGDRAAMEERLSALEAAVRATAPDGEADEQAAFVAWLREHNLIFLGAEGGGEALGLLREPARWGVRPSEPATGGLQLGRTDARSPVHRPERMDEVRAGDVRLIGLLTSRAYAAAPADVPLLRKKLERALAAEELIPGSHDFKAAVALFESFPREELLAAPADDLRRAIVALLDLRGDRARLLTRRGVDGRNVSVILAVPRERHDAGLVQRVRTLLTSRFGADDVDVHEVLGERGDFARVHFAVHVAAQAAPEVDMRALEAEVTDLARTWDDLAAEALRAVHGGRGAVLAARWLPRLPEAYKATVDPDDAGRDVVALDALHAGGGRLQVALRTEGGRTRVVVCTAGPKPELGVVLPALEHLGLRVVEERPTRLEGGAEAWIADYGVLGPGDRPVDLDEAGDRVAAVLGGVLRGELETDSLHRLVLTAGLDAERLAVLRAYRKYRQRIGSRFTEGYQNDVIASNPGVTRKLMELFALRFDPSSPYDEDVCAALRASILEDLEQVTSLDEDRILRNQLGLIEATVRTSAYRADRAAIAFKFRSADVPAIPTPAPLFEIFVFAPHVEGIHLRGGRVARGGLRWSDRMDYRTEVFGLMRAQTVKNAVIVPDGAKGGFYLRRRPADPAELKGAVQAAYETYINALLDVTDDLREGHVVHPPDVRCFDDEDPYLVVAADKGTATFSDTANRLAMARGFWLGDAFASGGSNGYDHKALGITARGAWESLKRHMRELGRDPAVDPFTVVGIGDMSGDVFGNGMLLSDEIRLVAAYDHRHVFVDPDPDPARQAVERRRLFELGQTTGSSWADFDPAVLSEGGLVVPRSAKRVVLTPQVQAALGVTDAELPPNELIRAILRAPVDVLWNGGIGTVVKAAAETDDDAQDRSSDAVRVDARDLRCRIVAEGGNLGLTQRARIEFSRGGGLVHADFIDNSAGVDCSDHEVNLKVLLDLAVVRGLTDRAGRDALLREVEPDVAAHVLRDSFLQAQILAQEVRGGGEGLFAYEDLMLALEAEGLVLRADDHLPGSDELNERRRDGRGLSRPELAVLLANAKRSLTTAVLASPLPDDDALARDVLREYFPDAVVERCDDLVLEHPLRRELVATRLANQVVDDVGPTFVARTVAEQGVVAADVVRAFRIARAACGAEAAWAAVEELGTAIERDLAWLLLDGIDELVEALTRRALVEESGSSSLEEVTARQHEGFERFAAVLAHVGEETWRDEREAEAAALIERGAPEALARLHAYRTALAHAPEAVAVARATGREIEVVAQAFAAVGDRLRLAWLEGEVAGLPVPTRMARWAAHALREDVVTARRDLVRAALSEAPEQDAEAAVDAFLERRGAALVRLRAFASRLDVEAPDLAALSLAVRHLRELL